MQSTTTFYDCFQHTDRIREGLRFSPHERMRRCGCGESVVLLKLKRNSMEPQLLDLLLQVSLPLFFFLADSSRP